MTAGRNLARAAVTALAAVVVLLAALQGSALAAAPELVINQPTTGSATNQQTPVFTGTTTDINDPVSLTLFDPITLDIYVGASAVGTPIQAPTASLPSQTGILEDTWEITPGTPLEQGQYTVVAEQTNSEAALGTSVPVTFTVEAAPVVTLTSPAGGAALKTSEPTLTGAAGTDSWDGPVTVAIHKGNSLAGSVVASEGVSANSGTWSYSPHLSDGVYTAQATQSDELGDTGTSVAVTFTVDTIAPVVTLTSPGEHAVLSVSDPTIGGGAGAVAWDHQSVAVTVHEGGSLAGPVVASEGVLVGGGTWSYSPHLSDGIYTVQAEQSDEAGNTGTSAAVTFTVDTTAPVVTLTSPVGGAVVNTSEPTLTGSGGTVAWDSPVAVAIHKGSSLAGQVVASESVPVSGGTWSYAPHLSDGIYTAQAEQGDEAGHTDRSVAVTFTVDTIAPVVTLTSPGEHAVLSVSDPTIGGGAGAVAWDHQSVAVTVHEGGSLAGPVVASEGVLVGGGTWSYSPHLSDGIYTVQAEQSDEAGNIGRSAAVTFTVDTTAPVVSMNTLTPPLTKDATPTLTGGAATAPWDDQSVTVVIQKGGSIVTSGSAPVIAGAWSYTVEHLNDGTYTAHAEQGDEAGHTGTSSQLVTFTVDTTPPAVSLTKPANHAVLAVSEPVFSGLAGHASGDEPSITLKIYEDEGGTISAAPIQEVKNLTPNTAHEWTTGSTGPRLSNGIYVAVAEQVDEAGNIGTSKSATFTIDTRSPEVTLDTSGFVVRGTRLMTGPTPSFSGTGATESEDGDVVNVNVYSGTSASGAPVRTVKGPLSGSAWTTPPVEALPDGTYTVQAEQTDSNPFSQTGVSNTATFTVDADQPNVTLTSPSNGSSTTSSTLAFSGAAGTGEGDLPAITVQLYSGSTIAGQTPLEAITVQSSEGSWSAVFGGLSPGTYTAKAEQSDDVGNVGRSEPDTFTVLAPPVAPATTPSPPVAAFKWIPSNPQTGDPVTLASSSSDGSSPITGYAWALAGNGVFTGGESTITTSFSTPGPHVVQLRVTDANGLSSTVAETIAVASAPVPLMQPFPVVRMSGSFGASGAKISLLAALAPVGATVTVTCHGRGCPAKSQAFVATSPNKSKTGAVTITFRRFERFLRGGVVLEIWISKHGQIGKFTRFVIHRGKSPSRVDECLNPAGTTPLVCPS